MSDLRLIQKANSFAMKKHGKTLDDSGNNYYLAHCFNVFKILNLVTKDADVLCAALLHDTIEDTDTTYEELVKEFNPRIADLVMEVTHEGSKDKVGYYFPRLKTQEGILIKFADRLSNLSRMEAWNKKRQAQYIRKSKFWKSEGK